MERELDTRDNIRVVTSSNFLKASGLEEVSLKARKLLYLAIAQCRQNDTGFYTYSIKATEFAAFMGISSSNVYAEADNLTDELMRGFIKEKPQGEKKFKKFQLFKTCEYTEDSELIFQMSEDMVPILLGLKRDFVQPLLFDFAKMKSNYSIEIWHLMQREMKSRKPNVNEVIQFELKLEELRMVTGTKDQATYDKLSNFKNRILDKALREIRDNCGVNITYENVKKGKTVVAFKFSAVSLFYTGDLPQSVIDRTRMGELRIQRKQRGWTPAEQKEYEVLAEIYGETD